MARSRPTNKYLNWLSGENCLAHKKVKTKCRRIKRKTKKRQFEYIVKNENFATIKTIWNAVKIFITNKGTISDENIKIKAEENQNIKFKKRKLVPIKLNDCIKDKNALVEKF